MNLNIKVINPNVLQYYKTYSPKHPSDSGIDLVIPNTIVIKPKERKVAIGLGIMGQPITHDGKPHGYRMIHRSSIYKFPIRLENYEGLIDYTYRGEITAFVHNTTHSECVIEAGTKLFQLVSYDLSPISLKVVDEIDETARGSDGFGSTGSLVQLSMENKFKRFHSDGRNNNFYDCCI